MHDEVDFLMYFAIQPGLRGQGYGGESLVLLKERYQNIVLEIETTYDLNSSNYKQRINRKRFYTKNKLIAASFTVSCYGVEMELLTTHGNIRYHCYQDLYTKIFGLKKTQENISLSRIFLPYSGQINKSKQNT